MSERNPDSEQKRQHTATDEEPTVEESHETADSSERRSEQHAESRSQSSGRRQNAQKQTKGVDLSDGLIERDPETGEIEASWHYVEELGGKVLAKPMNKAARDKFLGRLGNMDQMPSSLEAEMFNSQIVDPNPADDPSVPYDEYTEAYIETDMNEEFEYGLFFAVLLADDKRDVVENIRAARRGEDPDEDGGQGNL